MSWTPIKLIEPSPGSFELFRRLDESISRSLGSTNRPPPRSPLRTIRSMVCGETPQQGLCPHETPRIPQPQSEHFAWGFRGMTTLYKCPHCDNTLPNLIEDNGERVASPDLTLLCIARVSLGQQAYPEDDNQADVGSDGLVICGMQWEPNSDG